MAIPPAGLCDHTVTLRPDGPGRWRGRADAPADRSRHPGLVGAEPNVTLADGFVTLRPSWKGNIARVARLTPPEVRVEVGALPGAVVLPGDRLRIARDATGAFGMVLDRAGQLQVALGSVGAFLTGGAIEVQQDPRATDANWRGIAADLHSRPQDPWLRITIGGESVQLRQGAYAFHAPWHLCVLRVYEPGFPGWSSMIGVAREQPAVNRDLVLESARALALGRHEIDG